MEAWKTLRIFSMISEIIIALAAMRIALYV